ncbi:hypothetical protein GALMADRAFT_223895 [Galerina marginata CBS 339.88]|uniref:Uncharacterized protein n=1 Tax=Galerina marginata (strain CBS 339.88) TaxID=685588 RepID=A0A067T673_GALM3|nr:hypothetical protein GALMADRAFT_223895 [Galerina marginata CBS 339.88]
MQDWTVTYRALMAMSFFNAAGFTNGPPPTSPQPPKVFFIKLLAIPGFTPKTKPRAAFLVEDTEVLTMDEFRDAAVHKSHRLYNMNNDDMLSGYERSESNAPGPKVPYLRITMIVQSIIFHPDVIPMLKSWYWGDDYKRDRSNEWKSDNWLTFLKETVANGKGWQRDDVSLA